MKTNLGFLAFGFGVDEIPISRAPTLAVSV
jgi:uncharacterized membrane protein YidH (DUF202 family)